MNRRTLLSTTVLVTAAGVLTACGVLTASQLSTDAEAAANAVSAIAVTLEGVVPAADTAILTEIESLATTAGQDATAIGSVISSITSSSSTTASEIAGIVNAITTYDGLVAQFFPASAPIVAILNAALTVGEALYADAGITPPAAPMAAAQMGVRAKFGTPPMALDLARATLAKVPARGKDRR